jgi:hypothetical protein
MARSLHDAGSRPTKDSSTPMGTSELGKTSCLRQFRYPKCSRSLGNDAHHASAAPKPPKKHPGSHRKAEFLLRCYRLAPLHVEFHSIHYRMLLSEDSAPRVHLSVIARVQLSQAVMKWLFGNLCGPNPPPACSFHKPRFPIRERASAVAMPASGCRTLACLSNPEGEPDIPQRKSI